MCVATGRHPDRQQDLLDGVTPGGGGDRGGGGRHVGRGEDGGAGRLGAEQTPHMVHSHAVRLPLGALLSWCTMCGDRC